MKKSNQSRDKENPSLNSVRLVAYFVNRVMDSAFQGRSEPKYLQNYLGEFVFRLNRRKRKIIDKKFMRMVRQAVLSTKINYSDIKWDLDPISEYFAT